MSVGKHRNQHHNMEDLIDTMSSKGKLLTVAELAEILGMSPRTIYNRVRPGAKNKFPIKAKRVGGRLIRFLREDVDQYLGSL